MIEELIDEKLKIQLLKRFIIEASTRTSTTPSPTWRGACGSTPAAVHRVDLDKQGVKPETLKSRIKADYRLAQIVRGRFQSSFQFSDKDVEVKMQAKNLDDGTRSATTTRFGPILFVVPRGSPPAAFEARTKEAEALRARFQSCEEGIALARALRDVAVREHDQASPPTCRWRCARCWTKDRVGRLTAPEITQQGVEVYAVCGKKQSRRTIAGQEKVRDEMFNETFQALSKKFLKELRSQAMIEYR